MAWNCSNIFLLLDQLTLEDETWRTHGHVMDSVLKNDVIECTRTEVSVQKTFY